MNLLELILTKIKIIIVAIIIGICTIYTPSWLLLIMFCIMAFYYWLNSGEDE